MIKCIKCGNKNEDSAIYCSHCGNRLKNEDKKKILLVEPSPTTNFFLMKTFKNNGFDVKSLKNLSFVFDELSNKNYYAFVVDMHISDKSNLKFLKTLRKLHPNQNTIIMTPSISKEEINLLKSLNFNTILVKPIKAESILNYLEKKADKHKNNDLNETNFKYNTYKKENLTDIIKENIRYNNITHIMVFLIKNFTKDIITSPPISSMLDKIFNSIKRSDKFIIVEEVGIIIIPTENISDKGINIFKNKVKKMIDNEILIKYESFKYPNNQLSLSNLCSLIISGDFSQTKYEKKEKKPNKQEIIMDKISIEDLIKDRHLVFSALSHMKNEHVASLYLDEKFKKIIAPFITISQAEIIKNKENKADISHAKQEFKRKILEIAQMNAACMNDGINEKINSDISLMTLPEIQNNIIMLINEEASFKRIVLELQKDAAISSKVLKLVNSAFFGFARQIKNLERAAAILGTEEILGLSLSISYINSFDKNLSYVKKLWQENIAVMSIIKFIENEYKLSTASTTSSILSSIGKIFFAQYFPEQYINTINDAQKEKKLYDAVEIKYFSIPHTKVGASIIDMWNLPDKIKTSALYHTYPSAFSKLNTSLHLIHAAKYIAGAAGYSTTPQPLENMGYYTYTMLLKKHGVDVKKVYGEQIDELKKYIEDMMFLLL